MPLENTFSNKYHTVWWYCILGNGPTQKEKKHSELKTIIITRELDFSSQRYPSFVDNISYLQILSNYVYTFSTVLSMCISDWEQYLESSIYKFTI